MTLAIDLYCGLGGWTEGLLVEGYDVVGFDIERHRYSEHQYPAQLVLQDVRTLHGSQFRDASLIVASPPCQSYSYMAMPWKRAKKMAMEYLVGTRSVDMLNELFYACFRIQREASEAAGHYVPMIVENVCGAQKWVGRARWHYGSYYLWGDVPALMPIVNRAVKDGWLPQANGASMRRDDSVKVPSFRFDGSGRSFQSASVAGGAIKNSGGSWFSVAHNRRNPDGRNDPRDNPSGIKQQGLSGAAWFDRGLAKNSSRSSKRKAASAMIAKIPLELARHIGRVYAS